MTLPRSRQICLEAAPYYHCISRCVRRAFLCGDDPVTGQSFEHRRALIEERLFKLADVFCIEIAAYFIMHNHYHLGLYVNQARALELTDQEVCERWHGLFRGNVFSQRFVKGESLNKAESTLLSGFVRLWRKRLYSISWFMKCLNESIARQANKEDNCTGKSWEGRFTSQALLDEAALMACMAYIDLNPIRADIANK